MRSKSLILIALIAILIGLFGVVVSIGNEESQVDKTSEAVKEIVIKTYAMGDKAVRQSQLVHHSDFVILQLSEKEANEKGIDQDQLFELVPGAVYMYDIQPGKIIYLKDIIQPSDPGYVNLVVSDGHVPYPIKISPTSIIGGVISPGSYVDILALTGESDIRNELGKVKHKDISISPVLVNVKVLKVEVKQVESPYGDNVLDESYLILELDRKEVAVLSIAEAISTIEVHKSVGKYELTDLQANAGDVLPDFKAIKELRASNVVIK